MKLKEYLEDRISELGKLSISANEEFSDQMVARKAELERLARELGLKIKEHYNAKNIL